MGDAKSGPIRLTFNPQLRVEFRGATVTSDAGLLLPRELDDQLGLDALIEHHLSDPRTGHNRQFPLRDLFRQSIYSRLAGYEDTNDAKRLAEDPTFRMLASRERRETSVALTSTLHWFETDVLTEERNYQGLARLNTALIQHVAARSANQRVTLDIDSSESPVHGAQEQSAYNGHFESVCYHPLFVFNPEGDCLAAKLRPGNVHSADGWDEVLLPIIDRYRAQGQTVVVRADAAFALPVLYEALEHRGVRYAIRLPANNVLERRIEDLLTRPRGRPSHAPLVRYRSFEYQAASWDRPRRVIAKVEHHLGELFPRVGFIVTTLTGTNRAVVRFYNQRGTAEQWIKEGKAATHWTRLSCHRFRANEVRLLLGVIAYNLGNLLRRLVLPPAIQSWSLTSLQQRLFKTGGRLIRHARYFILQLAESQLTQRLFAQIICASSGSRGIPRDRAGGPDGEQARHRRECRHGGRPALGRAESWVLAPRQRAVSPAASGLHGSEGVTSPTRQCERGRRWIQIANPGSYTRRESADVTPGEAGQRFSMHAFGAVFVEIAVDPDLGETRVRRIVGAYGAGRIVNPKLARSQCLGGMIGGIGMALMEHSVVDARNGRVANANLAEYAVPVHADTPPVMDVIFVEEHDPHVNPLGVKGVGEIAMVGVPPAIVNAVFHATGERIRELPVTSDKLLKP